MDGSMSRWDRWKGGRWGERVDRWMAKMDGWVNDESLRGRREAKERLPFKAASPSH